MLATDRVFFVSSIVFVLAALAVWIAPKVKSVASASGAGH